MESNFENTIAYISQFWDWLENREDKDDKMSRRVWEIVEAQTEETRIEEVEERREMRREEEKRKKEEEIKKQR